MRPRWTALLLIALLPLRLWAGQLMPSLQTLPSGQAQAGLHPAPAQALADASAHGAHCHDHLTQGDLAAEAMHAADGEAAPGQGTEGEHAGNHASTHAHCDQCQLCHGGALPGGALAACTAAPQLPWIAAAEPSFIGTDPLPIDKPPIV